MANAESNGHVTDAVTWPWKVRGPNIFGAYLENSWRYRFGDNTAPTGNCYLGIKWSRDRWSHV